MRAFVFQGRGRAGAAVPQLLRPAAALAVPGLPGGGGRVRLPAARRPATRRPGASISNPFPTSLIFSTDRAKNKRKRFALTILVARYPTRIGD